jgi:hypothetical protein
MNINLITLGVLAEITTFKQYSLADIYKASQV